MKTHSIKLSNGRNTFLGKMIVADNALYFICYSKGNAMLEGAGIGLGGHIGNLLITLSSDKNYGEVPPEVTEADLQSLAAQLPGSLIFEANKIEKVQDNWLLKMIKWEGKKIGVPSGFSKELRTELIPWLQKHQIEGKGF